MLLNIHLQVIEIHTCVANNQIYVFAVDILMYHKCIFISIRDCMNYKKKRNFLFHKFTTRTLLWVESEKDTQNNVSLVKVIWENRSNFDFRFCKKGVVVIWEEGEELWKFVDILHEN